MAGLSQQQSQSMYGTDAYTAWDPTAAQADFGAKGGNKPAAAPAPAQPQPAANSQSFGNYSAPATTAPTQNNNPQSAQDLINMGYGGYAGWNDTEALADFKATGGSGKNTAATGGSGGGFGGLTTQPTIDLPGLYSSLSDKAGIGNLEQTLTAKQQGYNTAMSQINDNPYLSEANRTGRAQKLTDNYNADVKTTQDSLAMAKQDIQTQLDLQTKQFDINSQQAQLALSQFNSLLSSGALSGASGQDIANITKATGIPSGEIQAAIQSQVQKDTPTAVQTIDDGKNTYSVVINTKTGKVISQSTIGPSTKETPTALSEVTTNGQVYQVLTNTQTGQVISKTALGSAPAPASSSGSGTSGITPTQDRAINAAADKAIIGVDTNNDKLLSKQEYEQAVQQLMSSTGIDFNTADNYATQAFSALGFKKWNW